MGRSMLRLHKDARGYGATAKGLSLREQVSLLLGGVGTDSPNHQTQMSYMARSPLTLKVMCRLHRRSRWSPTGPQGRLSRLFTDVSAAR